MPLARRRPVSPTIRPAPPGDEEPIRPTGPDRPYFETLPGDVIRPPRTHDEEERRRLRDDEDENEPRKRRDRRTILHIPRRNDDEKEA